jgi:plasmid stabilization system protein ParE|tara:strand:- start:4 stop:279 length:276 start_codon:yes stop_codon:yes gene_type:complete
MKLVFHAAALADLQNIHDYISQDKPDIAVAVVQRIHAALDRLQQFPRSGRIGTVPETFELVVQGLPYIAVYELLPEQIEVIAIFHTGQDRR